ncbi:phosphatase PAP2 family protein [Rubrobacter aplysinae]|uniref:phosphatase PAP2 family protein n=1 Tax=Rubrobacter aplysinae TaxID=909625 RepID=UPI001364B0DE|nr:phosphatase PAP2 family protein [Rubrobacter aplysinae]
MRRTVRRAARRLHGLDVRVFRAVSRLRRGPLTPMMRGFTRVGTAGALWGVIAAAAFVFGGFYLPGLLVPWAAVAGAWILAEASKHLFDRARPHDSDMGIAPLVKTPSSSSFPSGHSATAAAGAITLSAAYPVFAPLLLAAGLLVMLSRIYLGVHYPSDVFVGGVIGVVCAALLVPLA